MSECDKIAHQYQGNDVFQWFLREGMSNSVFKIVVLAGFPLLASAAGQTLEIDKVYF